MQVAQTQYTAVLQSPDRITAADVSRFRRLEFRNGITSREEADALFQLNDHISDVCPQWVEFLADAISSFVIEKSEAGNLVSQNRANWLMDRINHDGLIKSYSELEILLRVMDKATTVPVSLVHFVLENVANAVVLGNGPLLRNENLKPGIITASEVNLLRRVLFSAAGLEGKNISEREADILFDLNDHTIEAKNDPEWVELFIRAIASYVLADLSAPASVRQLDNRNDEDALPGVLGVIGSMGKATFGNLVREADALPAGQAGNTISFSRTSWLLARLKRNSILCWNERKLLQFIRSQYPDLHPELLQLMNKAA